MCQISHDTHTHTHTVLGKSLSLLIWWVKSELRSAACVYTGCIYSFTKTELWTCVFVYRGILCALHCLWRRANTTSSVRTEWWTKLYHTVTALEGKQEIFEAELAVVSSGGGSKLAWLSMILRVHANNRQHSISMSSKQRGRITSVQTVLPQRPCRVGYENILV